MDEVAVVDAHEGALVLVLEDCAGCAVGLVAYDQVELGQAVGCRAWLMTWMEW